jgi:hypothetical protein
MTSIPLSGSARVNRSKVKLQSPESRYFCGNREEGECGIALHQDNLTMKAFANSIPGLRQPWDKYAKPRATAKDRKWIFPNSGGLS